MVFPDYNGMKDLTPIDVLSLLSPKSLDFNVL